jgi:hypothetical protein
MAIRAMTALATTMATVLAKAIVLAMDLTPALVAALDQVATMAFRPAQIPLSFLPLLAPMVPPSTLTVTLLRNFLELLAPTHLHLRPLLSKHLAPLAMELFLVTSLRHLLQALFKKLVVVCPSPPKPPKVKEKTLSTPSLAKTDCPLSSVAVALWPQARDSLQQPQASRRAATLQVLPVQLFQESLFPLPHLLAFQVHKDLSTLKLYLLLVVDLYQVSQHVQH